MLSRTERLDRLPVTSKHKRLLLGSGLGWALDAMDVGLISFIMAALAVHWDLGPSQTSWLASAGFLGMALGATFGGLLADKFGRRNVFSLTLLIYGLATGASALAGGLTVLISSDSSLGWASEPSYQLPPRSYPNSRLGGSAEGW